MLTNCLIKRPRLAEHLYDRYVNRVALSHTWTAKSAHLLVLTRGNNSPNVENTCVAIGVRVLGCTQAASELFNHGLADVERQLQTDMGEKERDDLHEETLRAEARQTALMNKQRASTQTRLQALQHQ